MAEISSTGTFERQANRFTDRPKPEAGRYRLVVSHACPWAHRAVIVRGLIGLDHVISLAVVDPIRDERGWRFAEPDPVLGITYLSEAYLATDPNFAGRFTVPALVDTHTGLVVTNDYPRITLDFETEWTEFHRDNAPDLYPEHLRDEMDAVMEPIYRHVNNGVYRTGFAETQAAYDEAFRNLFHELDRLTERLKTRRYLMGDEITEADIRLFTTLVRFDAVYHGHFKCNLHKLSELPVLWEYTKDLYRTPGFGDTVHWDEIKRHYYGTHKNLNPSGIVPGGPDLSAWAS